MTEKTKKIGAIIAFVLSVIAIATALYFMFIRSPKQEPIEEELIDISDDGQASFPTTLDGSPIIKTETKGAGQLSEADEVAKGSITQTTELTTGPVYNTVIGTDGKSVQYYNRTDGRFYKIDENGNVVKLSDKQFPNLEQATWNKDSEKAILEFPDGSNIIYNFETEVQVTLPKHWEDFNFSPVGNEIVAKSLALDPNNRWLVTANDSGSHVVPFQELGNNADKVDVSWSPNDQVLAFARTGEPQGGFDRKMIIPIGKNNENLQGLVVEGSGFASSWSPSGKKLLYSVSGEISGNKPLLWTVDATASTMGNNRKSLGINTWVDKCTWASESVIYCAVPQNLPENAGIAGPLYRSLPDTLYKIDILTGSKSLIAIPETETTITNLVLSEDNSALYFTNGNTDLLEIIKLK